MFGRTPIYLLRNSAPHAVPSGDSRRQYRSIRSQRSYTDTCIRSRVEEGTLSTTGWLRYARERVYVQEHSCDDLYTHRYHNCWQVSTSPGHLIVPIHSNQVPSGDIRVSTEHECSVTRSLESLPEYKFLYHWFRCTRTSRRLPTRPGC